MDGPSGGERKVFSLRGGGHRAPRKQGKVRGWGLAVAGG